MSDDGTSKLIAVKIMNLNVCRNQIVTCLSFKIALIYITPLNLDH